MIETERLVLRQWREQDRAPFASMNADPEVMQYFPAIKNREQSDQNIDAFRDSLDQNGWGFWAAELRRSGEFIGFIGLKSQQTELPLSPCIEVGWRLRKQYWRQGYASEGALASLQFAFEQIAADQIVSVTPVLNLPSIGVMRKIGMIDAEQNFDHPAVASGHRLSEHVLYIITEDQWKAQNRT